MITRKDISSRWSSGLNEGTAVYAKDGEKLGKVTLLNEDTFQIEKGFFFPKDFSARYDDIENITEDGIYLNQAKDAFTDWKNEGYEGWSHVEGVNEGRYDAHPLPEHRDRYEGFNWGMQSPSNEAGQRIQLAEERLEANKVKREAGNVRIHKIVHTDLKHFTVPVMREEVRIERTPVTDARMNQMNDRDSFKDQTIDVKVMEEQVEITKRPVIKEEIRVLKEQVQEQREVSGEVRREDIQVEKDLNRKKAV